MRRGVCFAIAALALGTSCHGARRSSMPDATVLKASEMDRADIVTAYDAVRLLRPRFLIRRGEVQIPSSGRGGGVRTTAGSADSLNTPVVFLDMHRLGGIERLQELPVAGIAEIRFLTAHEAQTLFGSGYPRGIIQVKRR